MVNATNLKDVDVRLLNVYTSPGVCRVTCTMLLVSLQEYVNSVHEILMSIEDPEDLRQNDALMVRRLNEFPSLPPPSLCFRCLSLARLWWNASSNTSTVWKPILMRIYPLTLMRFVGTVQFLTAAKIKHMRGF